jgi:hypothetical protein
VVAATAGGGKTDGEGQAVEEVAAVAEVDEGLVQLGNGHINDLAGKGVQFEHRTLAEVAAEVAAESVQADVGETQAGTADQEDAPQLAEAVAVEAVSAEDEGYKEAAAWDQEDAAVAEAPALAEIAVEGESAAVLLADTSAQPAAGGKGGTLVEGADEDEAPAATETAVAESAEEEGQGPSGAGHPATADLAAAADMTGLDAAQEGILYSMLPAVLPQAVATVAQLEPSAILEKAAGSAEPAAVAQITVADLADEITAEAEPSPMAVAAAKVAAIAFPEGAGADAEPGAAAADTVLGDDIRWLAADADVAAALTPEVAHRTPPAETPLNTAHDKGSQAVPEVAEALEETLPTVGTSQGATAEDEHLIAAASLAAEDFDSEPAGTLKRADQAGRVVDDEDLITAAALAMQDFDAAEDIAAEQALNTAALMAADEFVGADQTADRGVRVAAEKALITAAEVAADEDTGMGDEPRLEDIEMQAVWAAEGDEGDIDIEGKGPRLMAV